MLFVLGVEDGLSWMWLGCWGKGMGETLKCVMAGTAVYDVIVVMSYKNMPVTTFLKLSRVANTVGSGLVT